MNTFHCKFYIYVFWGDVFFSWIRYNVIIITRTTIESGYYIYKHNITLAYRIAKNPAPLTNVNLNGVVTSRVCRYIYHIYFVCRSAYLTQIYLFIYSKKMKILCTLVVYTKLMQILFFFFVFFLPDFLLF